MKSYYHPVARMQHRQHGFAPSIYLGGAKRTNTVPATPSVELETDRYRDRQDIGAGFHGDEICTAPHSLWTSINHRRPGPVCRYRNDVTQDMSCACQRSQGFRPVSYTHLRAHETRHDLVCRLLLEKKKK